MYKKMENFLFLFLIIPLVGSMLSLFPNNKQEKLLYGIALTTICSHTLAALVFTVKAFTGGVFPLHDQGLVLYQSETADFSLSLYFDTITMVYGMVASILTFLVTVFSRFYLHREKGYKRFFNNMLFFYFGINIIIFSGNFETLFIGWEVIGITSFFLIAFYRDRYLPVKNALKVMSLYRLADILLLLGIWACHHVFQKSISFQEIYDLEVHHVAIIKEPVFQLVIPTLFLLVALIKSAQVPFSSWLPRAMEGPTTSSAIFYGSLAVHMGLFLLMRTFPLWEHNPVFQGVVIFFGVVTVGISTTIARVQSTVKTQIAYSSIAQIGIMFIEVALGWYQLALVHFACNAFLRTYQLLVSPSVLHYLIHDQFYNFNPPKKAQTATFWDKLKLSVYVLSIKEWNLDTTMFNIFWQPIKKVGNFLAFIPSKMACYALLPVFFMGFYGIYQQASLPQGFLHIMAEIFAFLGIVLVLKAFTERESALSAWFLVVLNQLFTALSIGYNEQFDITQIYIFLSGVVVSAVLGYVCLRHLMQAGENISLHLFHGHSYERPRLATVFLLACLGLSGFPITPTFIGEDLILGHIHEKQIGLTLMTAFNLILVGLAIFRIYARVFSGPHEKTYHEVAYRSS
jgi:NADH-quinone oxidoreductase subunit L